ncbi:TetR/AcrR family transcriptional regulator [Leptogranulimonas caecicola]|uniref:TetR family transcriptional regulator n=1 Tax=Leptogranulimonas caecicola TaxID=2894156 RepID=A0AAU9C9Y2_9ACTN|nr:TetR-like C-terminal domain-containing protein [Leptogranulimonas caecicola]BDC90682.1 TetR family transcriptional regulator [Leptogranulimonas caecicola]
MPTISQTNADPRCVRTRERLRDALGQAVAQEGDLSRVTVTCVADIAGLTRRTFYSHYKDIQDLVTSIEDEALSDIQNLTWTICETHLEDVFSACDNLEPVPGAVELLTYFKERGSYLAPLLGPSGDPRFMERLKAQLHTSFSARALSGIDERALGTFFDYYITFAVSAECGVLERWIIGGMSEPVEAMARLMTLLMFVRPGDLYNNSYDLNIPLYGLTLMTFLEEHRD